MRDELLGTVKSAIHCRWNDDKNCIECLLPITLPTSKVRIKRKGIEPIAPRRTEISAEDLIEWQISYKNGKGQIIELGEILRLAYKNKLISKSDICSIIEKFENAPTFDETFYISREPSPQNLSFYGFKVLYEKTPILHLDLQDGCYIEIILKHKQKAVGYQPMVYIYIPMKNITPNLIGRAVKQKEKVIWVPRKEHILGLLKAFLLASKAHRNDIKEICLKIVKNIL
jgi:hypothetical protein